jgi:hypothetical protein
MTKIAKQSKAANTPMPRGSKPGERRGGRQRGTPNKKTALRNAAISAAIANPEVSPLEFLLGVMRDPNVSAELRIKVAQAAAPFVHAKPGIARSGNTAASVELIDDPTDLSGYGPQQARNDENRLHQLHCKRLSPPSCGGGALSESEKAEEAKLLKRIATFEQSPEGRAWSRLVELKLRGCSSIAEEDELKLLMRRFPESVIEPEDFIKDAIEAWRSVLES